MPATDRGAGWDHSQSHVNGKTCRHSEGASVKENYILSIFIDTHERRSARAVSYFRAGTVLIPTGKVNFANVVAHDLR